MSNLRFVAIMQKDVRVNAKRSVTVDGVRVRNGTANAITVRRTPKGLVVTNCCLEEQGL